MSENRRKAIVYVDGFNLYFALREKKWYGFMWLDVTKLAKSLLRSDQDLVTVKYFTSRVINNPSKQKRQNCFLDALGTLPGLSIYYGHYLEDDWECEKCGKISKIYHEKRTDVNIATEMLVDAYQNSFDDAVLITADSDLTSPIEYVTKVFKEKTVLIVFPPGRSSLHLELVATKRLELVAKKLRNSLLPNQIKTKDGFTIGCPSKWVYREHS